MNFINLPENLKKFVDPYYLVFYDEDGSNFQDI